MSNFNIAPRKTFTYSPPVLSKNNKRHFVRGLIDGDGSLCVSRGYLHLALCGASIELINYVNEYLGMIDGVNKSKVKLRDKTYVIQWNGSAALKIAKHLYDGVNRFLKRKKDVYAELCL